MRCPSGPTTEMLVPLVPFSTPYPRPQQGLIPARIWWVVGSTHPGIPAQKDVTTRQFLIGEVVERRNLIQTPFHQVSKRKIVPESDFFQLGATQFAFLFGKEPGNHGGFNTIQPEVTSQRIKKCQGTLGCQDRALEIRELQDKAL